MSNAANKVITRDVVEAMLRKYGVEVKVKDMALYVKATTHLSHLTGDVDARDLKQNKELAAKMKQLRKDSQQILEFEGDAALRHVFAKYLCRRYPNVDEGFLSSLKIRLEQRKALADFAKVIGLDEYILMTKRSELNGLRTSAPVLEDTFEAFIGALDIDQGFDVVCKFMFRLIEHIINFSEYIMLRDNYKDQLMHMYQIRRWKPPVYRELGRDPLNGCFTVGVEDNEGNIIATGTSKRKTEAEQSAAHAAIELILAFQPARTNSA